MERLMSGGLNPHNAVIPDEQHRQDFVEILEDFDQHCHESILLTREGWQLGVLFRILNEQEQQEFARSRGAGDRFVSTKERRDLAGKYKGEWSVSAFSEVYFNAHHTAALVYKSEWCGNLCGEGSWVGLELKAGQWKLLQWNSVLEES